MTLSNYQALGALVWTLGFCAAFALGFLNITSKKELLMHVLSIPIYALWPIWVLFFAVVEVYTWFNQLPMD